MRDLLNGHNMPNRCWTASTKLQKVANYSINKCIAHAIVSGVTTGAVNHASGEAFFKIIGKKLAT